MAQILDGAPIAGSAFCRRNGWPVLSFAAQVAHTGKHAKNRRQYIKRNYIRCWPLDWYHTWPGWYFVELIDRHSYFCGREMNCACKKPVMYRIIGWNQG